MKQEKPAVLISTCLLGVHCRYDGSGHRKEEVQALQEYCHLIPVCPEQLGGMKTPREPAERISLPGFAGTDRACVKNRAGEDVTDYFMKGAAETLRLAGLFDCRYAVLKERSPSCGCGQIYDGTFTGTRIAGNGITADLLLKSGIRVIGESGIDALCDIFKAELEGGDKQ